MSCPNYAYKLFVEAWSGQPNPTDVPLERQIVASMHGSAESLAMAAGYLVAQDFTDTATTEAFTQLTKTFKSVGGEVVEVSGKFGESLRSLRRVHGQRRAWKLGWELAYKAHTMTPEGWCRWAKLEIEKLGARMAASGLEPNEPEHGGT